LTASWLEPLSEWQGDSAQQHPAAVASEPKDRETLSVGGLVGGQWVDAGSGEGTASGEGGVVTAAMVGTSAMRELSILFHCLFV
jgi:hypothetical protein